MCLKENNSWRLSHAKEIPQKSVRTRIGSFHAELSSDIIHVKYYLRCNSITVTPVISPLCTVRGASGDIGGPHPHGKHAVRMISDSYE